ncbi:MAG: hypothetical protein OXC31_01715 [Spirochaetaceae bacterium]|nr:hypothetical protein [Spirochaetaceae bacterium]
MSAPWFKSFLLGPEKAVADLFSGRAGVGSSTRLDVPELLYQAFPPDLIQEREQLDQALMAWLLDMREDYASHVKRLGFTAYGKRVGDALIAMQLLELPEGRRRIREDLSDWVRWLRPLRLAPERDPALECFRLLTRGQPDGGHTALWLRLAADPRPEYLTVALAGLQLLPNQDNAETNQTLMLHALLRHSVKRHHEPRGARTLFTRHFAALRGLFPRAPQHWNRVLEEALEGFLNYTNEQLAMELSDTLRTTWLAGHGKSSTGRTAAVMPVAQEEWSDLQSRILSFEHPPETLSRRLFEILEQNHDYAIATGVSHFFVRTLHNIGRSLLEHHQLRQSDMTRLGLMIERSLVWEPSNPYCWMLWADWFQAQGHRDARESTLREMLRLFPSDVHARVELARTLIDRGEGFWDEAEHWLRQAMARDPDGGHSQVVMARLFVLRHRTAEAETMLDEFVERHPDNATAQQALGRLRNAIYVGAEHVFDTGQENEIREAIGGDGSTTPLTDGLHELFRRGRLAGEFSRAKIAKVRGIVEPTDLIRQETLKGDSLAGFYSQWLMPKETPECPPHAWAWNACRRWQGSAGPDDWRHLGTQFPEAVPETEFLLVLATTGDDSPWRAARWRDHFGSDDGAAIRPVDALMRETQERIVAAGRRERNELAVDVMACAAADAPEFTPERAA